MRELAQTAFIAIALSIAVLFLPLSVQLALFAVAVWIAPYRLLVLVPAVLSDAIYSPTGSLTLHTMLVTLVVLVFLLIRWLLVSYTRFSSVLYGVEA